MEKVKLKYYENLDGLRGIAAFAVIIFHFFGSHGSELTVSLANKKLFSSFTEILQHGVTLFFVLSGFVITRILLNSKNDNKYFSRFYRRRALRIFPLYYLYLIIHYYVAPWIMYGELNSEYSKQIVQFLYLQNMTWLTGFKGGGPPHFWSLAVEEHFYLIWPLILFLLPKKMIKTTTIILLILSVPIKYYFFQNGIDINMNTFSRFDSIMVGCLIAILERESNFKLKPIKLKTAFIIFFLILLFGFSLYSFQDSAPVIKAMFKHLILSTFFGLIIYVLITTKTNLFCNRFLENRAMQYFGKISYGLYVWHLLAMTIAIIFNFDNTFINLMITFMITIAISHISYFYYEKLFFKYK